MYISYAGFVSANIIFHADSIAVSEFVFISVELDKYKSETNPNNNLMMRGAALSKLYHILYLEMLNAGVIHTLKQMLCYEL